MCLTNDSQYSRICYIIGGTMVSDSSGLVAFWDVGNNER